MASSDRVPKPGTSTIQRENIAPIPENVEITREDLHDSGQDPTSWLLYGNNYQRHHHSTADIITPQNIDGNPGRAGLTREWSIDPVPQTREASGMQGSPLVVPGDPPIIYQVNGPEQVRAINARDGEILWTHIYHPKSPFSADSPPANRGLAVLGDTLYKATLDHGILALNRFDASEKWYYNGAYEYRGEEADGDPQYAMHEEIAVWERSRGVSSNYPLILLDDVLLLGSFGGEFGVSGWAKGITLDGEEAWHVNATPPDQWVGDAWRHGGATVWQAPAVDPDRGLAVFPSANPGPWFGTVRPGWNPYSAGKFAVDVESGEVQWNYQESPWDWWDYDSPSPAFVFEAEVDGEQRTLAAWPGKTAWVFTVDLETGELLQRSDEFAEHFNTWEIPPEGPDEFTDWLAPHLAGGTDPQPSSYDPGRNVMVLKSLNQPQRWQWNFIEYEVGESYVGEEVETASEEQRDQIPEWENPVGNVTALDPVSGEVLWQNWNDGEAPWGGVLTTATGVTFAGLPDGRFVAYETETGDRLWSDQVVSEETSVDGNPVSWVDPDTNKQYVYIQAGRGDERAIAVYSMEGDE